jgi:hypothetical protein
LRGIKAVRFALVLPVANLALWAATALLPVLFLLVRLGSNETHRFGDFTVHRSGSWLPFALHIVCDRIFPMTVAVNMPGLLVGAPISVPVISWLHSHPTALVTTKTWHTVSIPFFCLPAWWFLGNGLDRIREAKPLHFATVLVSSLLFISCIALAVGVLMSPPLDKQDLLPFFWGASVWTILFGIVPLTWVFQKHRRKRSW